MNVAECNKGKVLSQKYWSWYWQYVSKAVLISVSAIPFCQSIVIKYC